MTLNYQEQLKSIVIKAEEFDRLLTNIKKLNNELRAKSTKVLENITELIGKTSDPNQCKVCFSGPQTHMFYPCGHTGYCIQCATRGKDRGRCFECRQRIVDVVRYYL